MKLKYEEGKPLTISEVCGKDAGHFGRYMLAKETIYKLYETQYAFALNKKIELNAEEISALIEFVPELSKFHRAMSQ